MLAIITDCQRWQDPQDCSHPDNVVQVVTTTGFLSPSWAAHLVCLEGCLGVVASLGAKGLGVLQDQCFLAAAEAMAEQLV